MKKADKAVGHAHVDVLLKDDAGSAQPYHLFAVHRASRPRKLEALVAIHCRVALSRRLPAQTVVEHGPGDFGLGEDEYRQRETLDIPHDVAAIVVVVPPGGETEHRGAEKRSAMGRRIQVIERRGGDPLPALISPQQADSTLPDVRPGITVLVANGVEAP